VDELLARAMHGVDADSPGAFLQIFANLMSLVPWAALFWWNLVFIAVGALLGHWRGRMGEGIAWAALLGPIGWIVILVRPPPKARPLPDPRSRRRPPRLPR
jgi:hypothetical protein